MSCLRLSSWGFLFILESQSQQREALPTHPNVKCPNVCVCPFPPSSPNRPTIHRAWTVQTTGCAFYTVVVVYYQNHSSVKSQELPKPLYSLSQTDKPVSPLRLQRGGILPPPVFRRTNEAHLFLFHSVSPRKRNIRQQQPGIHLLSKLIFRTREEEPQRERERELEIDDGCERTGKASASRLQSNCRQRPAERHKRRGGKEDTGIFRRGRATKGDQQRHKKVEFQRLTNHTNYRLLRIISVGPLAHCTPRDAVTRSPSGSPSPGSSPGSTEISSTATWWNQRSG